MKNKKIIYIIAITVTVISFLNHWPDVKKGFVDGLNDGYSTSVAK
jgi:hypothetical protein